MISIVELRLFDFLTIDTIKDAIDQCSFDLSAELKKGNFQDRFGKMVVKVESGYRERVERLIEDKKYKDAEALERALGGFKENYGPNKKMKKAIGEEGRNTKKLNRILNKKIKVIVYPNGIEDLKIFVQNIVSPVTFKGIEVKDNEVRLNASTQSKAALIGRNKRRLLEMQQIIKGMFIYNPDLIVISWLIAIPVGLLAIALQCFILYFLFKSLASILNILMEMEFNSRGVW